MVEDRELPALYSIRAAIEDIEAAIPKLPPGEQGYRRSVVEGLKAWLKHEEDKPW